MATRMIEYKRDDIDKSAWGDGAWRDEPDKVQFVDDATDMDCLMVRNMGSGAWCGYVGTTEGHPCFAKEYDGCDVDVHGGLTFSEFCHEDPDPAKGICHVPFEGRAARVWWLGFDCAHLYDTMPAFDPGRFGRLSEAESVYRDRAYVEGECRRLAAQLKELA